MAMDLMGRGVSSRYRTKALQNWIENSRSRSAVEKGHLDSAAANVGIGEDLYLTTLQTFQDVIRKIRGYAFLKNEHWKSLQSDLERFIIWGDGFCNGKLDQALNRSGFLKTEVLTVLNNIAKLLLRTSKRLETSALEAPILALQGLIEKVAEIIEEHGSNTSGSADESADENDGDSDDDGGDESVDKPSSPEQHPLKNWVVQLCKDLHCHTLSLMDLVFSIEQTLKYADISSMGVQVPPIESFKVSGPAQVYVSNILDKFPQADLSLVRRLGQKNWERHQSIRLKQQQIEEASSIENKDAAPSLFRPFSLFHDSGLGLSISASSGYAQSVLSHSSFVSSLAEGEKSAWRVPPLPIAASTGKPFICQICGQTQHKIKNRVDWKIHVFADLQPYICTFAECTSGLVTFEKRSLWAEHEFNVHRMQKNWICHICSFDCKSVPEWHDHLSRQHDTEFSGPLAQVALDAAEKLKEPEIKDQDCPFCHGISASTRREFVTHIGRHMEEVALATLPKDEPSDNSDAGSVANSEADTEQLEEAELAVAMHSSSSSPELSWPPQSLSRSHTRSPGPSSAIQHDIISISNGVSGSESEAQKPLVSQKMSTFFINGDGIDREVITNDITRYLGNDALVKPGTHTTDSGKEVKGYFITSYRAPTANQLADLRGDTLDWHNKRLETRMTGYPEWSKLYGGRRWETF